MSVLRAAIVDDERLARQKIRSLLAAHPDVEVVAEYKDGAEAVEGLRRTRPDLVFLDIQMPGGDGFEVVRRLRPPLPAIVFVTAHDEHAIRAFEVEAVDYLLKPFDRRRFGEALRRARNRIERGAGDADGRLLAALARIAGGAAEPYWTRIAVKGRDRIVFVAASDVDWIESQGKYVLLHAGAARHLVREGIGEMERRLDPREFARVHRRVLVNLRRVAEIRRGVSGEQLVKLTTGATLPASRRYFAALRHVGGTK
jgi:two-component system, LytTR family, response regulator